MFHTEKRYSIIILKLWLNVRPCDNVTSLAKPDKNPVVAWGFKISSKKIFLFCFRNNLRMSVINAGSSHETSDDTLAMYKMNKSNKFDCYKQCRLCSLKFLLLTLKLKRNLVTGDSELVQMLKKWKLKNTNVSN